MGLLFTTRCSARQLLNKSTYVSDDKPNLLSIESSGKEEKKEQAKEKEKKEGPEEIR